MDILKSMYSRVLPLQQWIEYVDTENMLSIKASDSQKFSSFLESTFICQRDVEIIHQPRISLSQITNLRDVVLKVIQVPNTFQDTLGKIEQFRLLSSMERIKEALQKIRSSISSEENVLMFGFGEMSEDDNAQISDLPDIEYRYPNSSLNRLMSGNWKRLHQRIGDSLMEYILEQTSVFCVVPHSSYVQLTGMPAFSLVKSFHPVKIWKTHSNKRKHLECAAKESSDEHKPQIKRRKMIRKTDLKNKDKAESVVGGEKPAYSHPKPYNHFKLFSRKGYFYTRNMKSAFPAKFSLEVLDNTDEGARSLFREIFETSKLSADGERSERGDKLCSGAEMESHYGLQIILKQMIKNHRNCNYRLIHNCCCQASLYGKGKANVRKSGSRSSIVTQVKKSLTTRQLLSRYCTHRQPLLVWLSADCLEVLLNNESRHKVFLFVRRVLLTILPASLLGDYNTKQFLKHIRRLIFMGKYDKFGLGEVMKCIKTKRVHWLKDLQRQEVKLCYMSMLICWLVNFVMVLLKSYFYITETTKYRNKMFYYRKHIWQLLHGKGWLDLKRRGIFQMIPKEEVLKLTKEGSSLGVSSLRFLPKQTSLRPLINLGLQPPSGNKSFLPINKQLQILQQVLTYVKKKDSDCVGFAVSGLDEIYTRWKDFVVQRKARDDQRPLYFVKTDIRNCYDEIDQEKLYSIVRKLLELREEKEYITRRYATIKVSAGRLLRKYHRHVSPVEEYEPDFFEFVTDLAKMQGLRNLVIINQVVFSHDQTEELLQKLKAHLFRNIIKVGRQYYVQTKGISQGSVVSTLLCNLYYGELEKRLLTLEEGEMLMRVVDDALFVTPSKDRAIQYLRTVIKGIPEFNFAMNSEKTTVNFEHNDPEFGHFCTQENVWLPWCGLLFNTDTLEVSNDFSRYAGLALTDAMSFDITQTPTSIMKSKLLNFLRPQCHKILLDPCVNSFEVIFLNCYKLLLLLSNRFHCYNKMLPYKSRADDRPSHFLDMIIEFGQDFYHRVYSANEGRIRDEEPVLSRYVCLWLVLKTFEMTLTQHHSMYHSLLKLILVRKKALKKKISTQNKEALRKMEEVSDGWMIPSDFLDNFIANFKQKCR